MERGINPALPSPGREDMGQSNLPQTATKVSLSEETHEDPDCVSDTEPSAFSHPWEVPTSGSRPWCTPLAGCHAQGHVPSPRTCWIPSEEHVGSSAHLLGTPPRGTLIHPLEGRRGSRCDGSAGGSLSQV